MDPDRWARVQEIFHQVVDLPTGVRHAEVDARCGGDATLVADVHRLLAADAGVDPLLDQHLGEPARALLHAAPSLQLRVGAYHLGPVIGEGGMGVVYRASRDDLESVAAVKILRDAWASPARRDRFLLEQRTLAHLNHPGIAHLLDAGTLANGTPWIAMEFVEGVPITEFVRAQRLPLRARLALLRLVCDAVQHAHQQLVVHRDIKPSNILVRADGTVKLLDFGIAKQLDAPGTDGSMTKTGQRLMTPAYASPEQIRGRGISAQTDVYSLGVVLFELLTGGLPYELADKTPGEAEDIVANAEVPRPSSRPAAVAASRSEWGDLDVLCLTAMHKDLARRYGSVEAFSRDLSHFLRGEPLDARDDSLGYRASKFLRRHTRAVAATVALAVGIATLVTFYTMRVARARDVAIAERTRALRIQQFMTRLFQGGDDAAGPADSLRVITLLDQGAVEARTLDREPAVQADLYQTLGNIHRQLGQLDRADSLLQSSRSAWQRLQGPTGEGVVRAQLALGELRVDQARYDAADTLLRGALDLIGQGRPGATAERAEALVAIARALTERGEHKQAIAVLDSAVGLFAVGAPDTPEHLRALTEIANARFYDGQYDAADSTNRQVLAMTKRIYGERHPLVAEDLMNLGATEQERGNYLSSERYFREALALTTSFYGEQHYRTAGNLVYLGRSLLLQNRRTEARDALTRALTIREQVYGKTHPSVANTLNELGSLAIREERYDDAETDFRRVRQIFSAAYPGYNFRVGVAIANLADVHLYRKQYVAAERLFREALEHYVASQGPDHLNTGIGYIKLGRTLMRAGRFREGEQATLRGYGIVSKVASPGISFLQAARLDLSIMYDSLGQPVAAARFRREREEHAR